MLSNGKLLLSKDVENGEMIQFWELMSFWFETSRREKNLQIFQVLMDAS